MARTAIVAQAFSLVVSGVVLVAAWFHSASKPFDPKSLALDVAQLRTHAAEAALLIDGAHSLPSTLVREHARQLAGKVATIDQDLARRDAGGSVSEERRAAIDCGNRLHPALVRVAGGPDAASSGQTFAALAAQLATQQHRLDPSG